MRWYWQYLGALVLAIINVDFMVIPFLKSRGMSGVNTFLIASFFAIIEQFCWYSFWLWLKKIAIPEMLSQKIKESKDLQKGVVLGKELKNHLQHSGYLKKLRDYFLTMYNKMTDENNNIVKRIKRWGHIAMLLVGADPYSGGRTVGVIFCSTFGWRNGLYTLAIGNIIHVAYVVGIWNVVFSVLKK